MHTPALPGPAAEAAVGPPATAPGRRVAFLTHYAELYGANRSLLDLIDEVLRGLRRPRGV
jgi:hypothetical protein